MTGHKDDLGDRMKGYEAQETTRMLMPRLPICVRLDGRSFSEFTSDMPRPYCTEFSQAMQDLTAYLVVEFGAVIGYTQSDEISLVIYADDYKTQNPFGGKPFKLISTLAAVASVRFNRLLIKYLPNKTDWEPTFDCRVWNVPTLEEAANTLLWRERDATKNSISMATRSYYSHKEMHKKSGSDMQAMFLAKDINWNNYPNWFKRGSFYRKVMTKVAPEAGLIEHLRSSGLPIPEYIERATVVRVDMPPFGKVINRVNVVFNGDNPVVATE